MRIATDNESYCSYHTYSILTNLHHSLILPWVHSDWICNLEKVSCHWALVYKVKGEEWPPGCCFPRFRKGIKDQGKYPPRHAFFLPTINLLQDEGWNSVRNGGQKNQSSMCYVGSAFKMFWQSKAATKLADFDSLNTDTNILVVRL